MTPTSDERRKVAERLRSVTDEELHYVFLEEILCNSIGRRCINNEGDIDDRLILNSLADLIDVPTTRNIATDKTRTHAPQDFVCECCGYWAAIDPGFRYCSECGAEVMNDNE